MTQCARVGVQIAPPVLAPVAVQQPVDIDTVTAATIDTNIAAAAAAAAAAVIMASSMLVIGGVEATKAARKSGTILGADAVRVSVRR